MPTRFAPVVRLVEQVEECGPGEPYDPIDVDLLFGRADRRPARPLEPDRPRRRSARGRRICGTASSTTSTSRATRSTPAATTSAGRGVWRSGTEPTVYAHVATEAGYPGQLALQYWFFYTFNDFNNTHEGDWEMIQLVFDANDAREALGQEPATVGYSSHEGAEQASWDDDKLDVVDETHPVVYPGAGSHANKYTEALYLGSSAEAGVGCDDTRGPHRELRPAVVTIPSAPAAARPPSPGSTSRGGGASSRGRSSTGPPART